MAIQIACKKRGMQKVKKECPVHTQNGTVLREKQHTLLGASCYTKSSQIIKK